MLKELQNERERLVAIETLSEQPSEDSRELQRILVEKQAQLDSVRVQCQALYTQCSVRNV